MAGTKEIRNQIASVKSTQKITKAMQMVAAAKLRRAQEAAVAARPYSERMSTVIGNLASAMSGKAGAPTLLTGTGFDETHLLIVATAERGLCGGFNSSIAKLAREHADRLLAQGKTVKIFTVGKKGNDALKRLYGKYFVDAVDLRGAKTVGYEHAQAIAQKILAMFDAGEFDVATLFFAEFKSGVMLASFGYVLGFIAARRRDRAAGTVYVVGPITRELASPRRNGPRALCACPE